MKDTLVQNEPNREHSIKMKASQVRELSREEREKYMVVHTAEASREYRQRPKLLLGVFMLLSMISCHSSTSGPSTPPPPPAPAGSISYTGHAFFTGEAISSHESPIWYAYWTEPPDSSAGTLTVGLLVDGSSDTLYLSRQAQGWAFAQNDPRANDTSLYLDVFTTSDSITVGWGSKMPNLPISTTYYLKKLN
jgi:hypothetical protein